MSFKKIICGLFFSLFLTFGYGFTSSKNRVIVYPAPNGTELNHAIKILAGSYPVAVYMVKVGAADASRRFNAVDDLLHSETYFDKAAFAYFDLKGSATVSISFNYNIKSVKILPTSVGIKATINKRSISFQVSEPNNLTIEVNGEVVKSLHLFVNPIETNKPSPNDPNVVFFGPGVHEVEGMVIGDNKTVYIAGGAVVRAVIGAKEPFGVEPSGLKNYTPSFELKGHHIRFRGRGIIDASACTTHARNFIMIRGSDISLEGIILVNSSGWTVPIRQSNKIEINNIKILGYRANSDGIDICNSHQVTISNCFIRTNDDLIVVKTEQGEGDAGQIVVKRCVLWNQLANALSLGAELRDSVNNVLFTDCDIIHDYSRAWCLRIFHSDASIISNITFDNIRLEEAHQLISLSIVKDIASYNTVRGQIHHITFSNIKAYGHPLNIDIVGAGESNKINDVIFKNIFLNDVPLTRDWVKTNAFVQNIIMEN